MLSRTRWYCILYEEGHHKMVRKDEALGHNFEHPFPALTGGLIMVAAGHKYSAVQRVAMHFGDKKKDKAYTTSPP